MWRKMIIVGGGRGEVFLLTLTNKSKNFNSTFFSKVTTILKIILMNSCELWLRHNKELNIAMWLFV